MGMDYDDLKIKEERRWYVYAADDVDIAFKLRYVGAEPSCKIAVAADGKISSVVGAVGAEAADANFTVGATPGTIDPNNALANTIKKLVNFINGLNDYECWPVDSLPGESSDDTLLLLLVADGQCKNTDLDIHFDTSVRDAISMGCGAADHLFTVAGRENIVFLATIGIQTATSAAFNIYLVDDTAGTSELIETVGTITGGADLSFTATNLTADGVKTFGKRLVVWAGGTAVAVGTGGSVKTGLFVFKQSTKIEPQHRGQKEHYENWG